MTAIARRTLLAGMAVAMAGPAFASTASQLAFAPGVPLPEPVLPTLPDTVVHDDSSGLALHGFDPVAYFITGRPVGGRSEFELTEGGAVWRFASRSNLAAFSADPDAWKPLFGAHDPVALAVGRLAESRPQYFLVDGDRLMLFRNARSRAALVAEPQLLDKAKANWPALERQLPR